MSAPNAKPKHSSSSSSPHRIEANRRNAQKSTGPRTPEGKAKCARNALTHGLTARVGLLPGEDLAEFEQFEREMLEELQPVNSLQRVVAQQVVWAAWRLRRVPQAESAVLRRQERDRLDAWERRQARRAQFGGMLAPALGLGDDEPQPGRRSAAQVLADRFTDPKHDPLARVEAHALRLQRSFFSSLRAFQQLQKDGREAVEDRLEDDSGASEGGPEGVRDELRLTAAEPGGAAEGDREGGSGTGGADAGEARGRADPNVGSDGGRGAGHDARQEVPGEGAVERPAETDAPVVTDDDPAQRVALRLPAQPSGNTGCAPAQNEPNADGMNDAHPVARIGVESGEGLPAGGREGEGGPDAGHPLG